MAKYTINIEKKLSKISKEIYGHFSEHLGRCIYEGIYVGENSDIPNVNGMRKDVVQALKEIKIPVIRWPGGCFADEYHWKDGIGPKENRKKIINTHWGGAVEDNSFGTHEFMELCRQLECEPYINGNLGSGTVQEMSEWVEYLTFNGISPMAELRKQNGSEDAWQVKYFGVGNENWGCGGNMTPEFYGNMYRRYQTYCRNYPGNKLYKIACGPNVDDYNWTEGVMKVAANFMDALTIHYYTHPGGWLNKGPSRDFDNNTWYTTMKKTLRMEELINNHLEIMNKYDPDKRVDLIIDEWGSWYDVEPGTNPGFLYQQNTMRDALIAGINLNIFNKHSDRVKMANLAQIVNVLQAVILTEGEKMILTPTYHVFNMYKDHQEANLVYSNIETKEIGLEEDNLVPNLHESASIDNEGRLIFTINNLSITEDYKIETVLLGKEAKKVRANILTNEMTAYNTFDNPNLVNIKEFNDFTVTKEGLNFTIPKCSVMRFIVE
ncbi:alpha-L-arabinofuranosidase C-terminal domain-containing protein [Clostridium sp.]|uniref:alpha-N-arabinofuranosidase n=1 Tax=Clostridium sp. TaxID=1506 RepID=UPI001DCF7D68|nr:alpha-L-arabinofuranosidase C-terminal domain-containing protein [Clostridium sp.]MBS5938803.1 alpha-N-arabinofuranosidase [Clostridium sp.]